MIEKFIAYFEKHKALSAEEKQLLRQSTKVKIFKKGHILLSEGVTPRDNYFIIKGCVRQYHISKGEDRISNFYIEEDWILPFTNVQNNGKSRYFLECVEDSHLVVANEYEGNEFLNRHHEFQSLSIKILEKEIIKQHNELSKYISETPEQRYLNLQKKNPDLLQRVPQYQISSYLGIKPESLSRIRKRINTKN